MSWGLQKFEASRFRDNRVIKWLVCLPYAPIAFSPKEIFLVFISLRGSVDFRTTGRPEVLYQWKISMISSRIQTVTFRHVAHSVEQMRQRVRPSLTEYKRDSESLTCKEKLSKWSLFSTRNTNVLRDLSYYHYQTI